MADVEGSSGGDVGAVGEPTPTSDVGHVASGRDVGAEGEPMSAPEGEQVGCRRRTHVPWRWRERG